MTVSPMISYQTAKNYIDNGWSIFPVVLTFNGKKFEKKPAVKWQEYQTRFATETELHSWFDNGQFTALGLATGKLSKIVVVDVDKLDSDLILDTPIVAQTISGGKHYYFSWTEEMRNTVRFIDGVDFRGDGGFVVIPPSVCGAKGYSWLKAEKRPLPPVPESIKWSLSNQKIEHTNLIASDFLKPAEVGTRDDSATRIAGWLINKLPEKDWDKALEVLKLWNNQNPEPLDEQQIAKCFNSVARRQQQQAIEEEVTLLIGKKAESEYARLETQYGQGITTGYFELDEYFKFLPQQLYLLSASTHQGKTTMALNMCARVAKRGHHVLFASLEQGVFIVPRIKTMVGSMPETLTIMTSTKLLSVKAITETIANMSPKPELVCIDHLHFIKKKGVAVTADIDEMIINIQNMAKEMEIPVLLISHVRKINEDKTPTMDDLRDSSSLSQVPSVVLLMHRPQNKDVRKGGGFLQDDGVLIIAKNRIQGRTGGKQFRIYPTGVIEFSTLPQLDQRTSKEELEWPN